MTDDLTADHRLKGRMGTFSLVLSVLAFNGPLTVVVGYIPVTIAFGNGLGAPVAFIAAGVIIGIFAVGFTTMGRSLPNPGAFYAYITAGLGKPFGLGSSYLALLSYFFILANVTAFFGISLQSLVHDTLNGPDLPWWICSTLLVVMTGVLGTLRIDFSVRVLGILLGAEFVLIMIYDAAVIFHGGAEGLSVTSFSWSEITSGSVGVAVLFAITCFSGFEATAIFREETRDPGRTITRSTYLAVIVIGVIYMVGAWVMIQALGPGKAVASAAADPTGSFYNTLQMYVGSVFVEIVKVFLCTSIFACSVSTHNVTTRYLFNLSIDGILPQGLSVVHKKFGSPSRASLATSVIIFVGLGLLVASNANPAILYAILAGIGGYSLILLLLFTSVAVVVYLKRAKSKVGIWKSTIAPVLATIGLLIAAVLATLNLDVLVGNPAVSTWALVATFATIAVGIVHALILRKRRSPAYPRIGRQSV